MNHENSEVPKSILHPPNRMAHCRYRTVDCTTSATDSTARTNVKGINKARGVTCHFLPHPFKFISPQFSSRAIFVSTKKCTSPLPRGTFIKFPLNSVNSEWRGSNYATNREILCKPHRHWTKQCSLQIPRKGESPAAVKKHFAKQDAHFATFSSFYTRLHQKYPPRSRSFNSSLCLRPTFASLFPFQPDNDLILSLASPFSRTFITFLYSPRNEERTSAWNWRSRV